jgi:hypothetical protein
VTNVCDTLLLGTLCNLLLHEKPIHNRYSQTARQYRILNPLDMTVNRYSSVEFDELQKGGPLLKEKGQDCREQGSEILLDLEAASNRARNTRESSHI